jgi:hypothetical protein
VGVAVRPGSVAAVLVAEGTSGITVTMRWPPRRAASESHIRHRQW